MSTRDRAPVSVIVPVKNEAANITACLDSVAWASEVFVVDSNSDDDTVEIARGRGATVTQFRYSGDWPKKKNWALENLPFANEWVLILDADERITPALAQEIREAVAAPEADGYYINRRLIFLGRWIRHCGWYPSWNLRLFRHPLGRYERLVDREREGTGDVEVHEHVVLDGREGYLENDMIHEDFKDVAEFVARHNRYSTWEVEVYRRLREGDRGTSEIRGSILFDPVKRKRWIKGLWVRAPLRPLLRFLYMYVLRRGFLDGRPGFLFCVLMSFHEAVISAKLYERDLQDRERRGCRAAGLGAPRCQKPSTDVGGSHPPESGRGGLRGGPADHEGVRAMGES